MNHMAIAEYERQQRELCLAVEKNARRRREALEKRRATRRVVFFMVAPVSVWLLCHVAAWAARVGFGARVLALLD